MLNPPLSLLSDDLFLYIVDHVAEFTSPKKYLSSLSIADRAFTRFCQAHIFKVLRLRHEWESEVTSSHLTRLKKILNDKPTLANSVRVLELTIPYNQNGWLFNDLTFISIFQLLAKSLMPPRKLHLSGRMHEPFIFEDPILIVGRLMQTFFSQTLTVLHLTCCENVPLTIFLVCPGLREILLYDVRVSEESYDTYPDGQCSSPELPTLDRLYYYNSESLVKQMITPPHRFHTAVVLWSKLRVLTLCPYEKEEMDCLQPILDAACNTLEKLYLTLHICSSLKQDQLSLAGLVNLKNLSCLHVFALHATIDSDVQNSTVLHDINLVLSTIPTFNQVTSLTFDFDVFGEPPFRGCLEEDWVGLCHEVVRISAGKHLNLKIHISVEFWFNIFYRPTPEEAEMCERIKGKITSLSEYSHICTQFNIPPRSYDDSDQ